MNDISAGKWWQFSIEALQKGQSVQILPRGHSMQGIIEDGELISIQPCHAEGLRVGDAVLARVKRKRVVHVVVHLVHKIDDGRFLIGSNNGRLDGWVQSEDIFGKVTQIHAVQS